MSGKFFFILLLAPAWFAFKDGRTDPPALRDLYRTYSRSDRLYSLPNATEASNREALAGFRQITDALPRFTRSRETDSIFFQSLYKSGVLYELAGDYNRATWSYLQAITLAPDAANRGKMDVFTGAGYYNLNNFDSANYFLLRAEEDGKGQLAVEDRVRLYNTLGVLFYDNGNYLQAKNYFNRGLMLLQQQPEPDKLSLLSVRLNMATCYYRLNLFDEALAIYRQAIQEKVFPDQIYMNMGRAYAGLHRYAEALSAFHRVDQKRLPWVLNEMAKVEMESGRTDSAACWLARFRKTESRFSTNKIDSGINMLYSGELYLSLSNSAAALQHLQQAIILFSGNFNDTAVRHNPAVFTGTFTYYRLFDALSQKSLAWEQQYKKTANGEDLLSALDAYRSTISLLTYIERSYEMDDAKILLKQKSAAVYQHAVSVCLKLDSLFPNRRYLEEAFVISERSKASVMASNLREENFHFVHHENDSLIRTERNIKFNIARLSIEAEQTPDALEKINAERSVYESELALVQKKLERDSRYYQLKYQEDYPSVQRLQESLQESQALISISNEDAAIQVFAVTRDGFHHLQLNAGDSIRRAAMEWIHYLQSAESERHANAVKWQQQLYRLLIKPLEQIAGDRKEWILVPDGLFFLLPLESLPSDDAGTLLIEKHALSYQFSSRFIPGFSNGDLNDARQPVLAFAPFVSRGADLRQEGLGMYASLPGSSTEIASIDAKRFIDSTATKQNLLDNIDRFPILHLATHAIADMDDPSNSYIALFPSTRSRPEDFLFLGELYGLRMDSCQLVVISACETGKGQMVTNEGVMSFARAFMYAGCPSTVNSLWKADDHSTGEILRQFYVYLAKGYSKSEALQQAKLDFIHKNPLYRDPVYWSHLILTGNMNSLYKKKQPYRWAVLGLCCSIAFLVLRKRKKSRRLP